MINLDQRSVFSLLLLGGVIGLVAAITEPSWREIVGLLAGGAIGILLVYGYQRWLKRP